MHYLAYQIHTLEPVKMGSQNKAESTEYALSYIAGSAVRGALLGAYCRKYGVNLATDREEKKHLLQDMFFLNAYPMARAQRTIPAPLSFLAQKQTLSQYSGDPIEINLFDFGITAKVEKEQERKKVEKTVKKEPFVLLSSDSIYGVKVHKSFQLHISVNGRSTHRNGKEGSGRSRASREDNRAMFRYEALDAGQDFMGYIASEDGELIEKYRNILENETCFYLGGSKGSGYGRVRMTLLPEAAERETAERFSDYVDGEEDKTFYVYMLSDSVVYDKDGFPVSHIPVELLREHLQLEDVQYLGGASDVVRITGYNSTWRAAKPQYVGICAGSILKYSYSGSLTGKDALIRAAEDQGVGIMRQEGFGRFMIIPELPQRTWQRCRVDAEKTESIPLSDENLQQARMLMKHLYRQQVERGQDKQAVQLVGRTNSRLRNAQIGNLMNLIQVYRWSEPSEFKKTLKQYFEHMEEKERNQDAIRQFRDTKITDVAGGHGKQSLDDYLLDFVRNIDNVSAFIGQPDFRLNNAAKGIGFQPDEADVCRYNIGFLLKYLKLLRKGDEND